MSISLRILVVDDNPHICRVVATMLHPIAEQVRCCGDAEQAFEAWRFWNPDLVILDYEMRPLDGAGLTRRIRQTERGRRTAILMMTAHCDREHVLAGQAAGVDELVAKPLTLGALLMRSNRAMTRAAATERTATLVD